jgi:hypothetical protein
MIADNGIVRPFDWRYLLTSAGTGSVHRRFDPAFPQTYQVAFH